MKKNNKDALSIGANFLTNKEIVEYAKTTFLNKIIYIENCPTAKTALSFLCKVIFCSCKPKCKMGYTRD